MAGYSIPAPALTDSNLDEYFKGIAKYPQLSREEERELARKAREEGDLEARNGLVEGNLRFVVTVATSYQGMGLSLPELINEGNVGLITAAERFDERKGVKFISYAVWWIRQSILQALAEQSRTVRMPLNKIAQLIKINRASELLWQELDRRPDIEELAEKLEISPKEVEETLRVGQLPLSLDQPFGQEGEDGRTFLDTLAADPGDSPEDAVIDELRKKAVQKALEALNEREAEVIKLYFGLGDKEESLTLDEIGERYNLTSERVRQIKEKALGKLRHPKRRRELAPFRKR